MTPRDAVTIRTFNALDIDTLVGEFTL